MRAAQRFRADAGPQHAAAALVALLTGLGLYLRLRGAAESLASDEIFMYSIVHGHDLGRVLTLVHDTESTPPLHFVLAWASDHLGGSETWIRLPSVVLGTATVPVVYVLGLRTVGRPAALVAAAVVAISPFAVFYGSEGRAYATLGFISAVSTLALVAATRTGRARWWVAFALACTAALYTHYTAVFVVAAQIVWALAAAPARRRAAAMSAAAIALLYVPWIPSFLVQSEDSAEQRIEAFHASTGNALLRTFPGRPFVPVGDLPGQVWAGLLALVVAGVALLLVWRGSLRPRPRAELVLIAAVALAAPVGAWLYTLGPTSILLSRNLVSSFPAFCLLLGAFLMAVHPPRLRAAAVTATLLVVAVGSIKTLDDEFARPAFRDVGRYLDRTAAPGKPIITELSALDTRALRLYLDSRHRLVPGGGQDETAWRPAARGGSVFVVRPVGGLFFGLPRLAGPGSQFMLRESRSFPGLVPVLVGRYSGRLRAAIEESDGRRVLRWSLGPPVRISPKAGRGHIDEVSTTGGTTTVIGWATDPAARRPADWVLLFSGGRLLAVVPPHELRPDLATAYGPSVIGAGFRFTVDAPPDGERRLRVFAVSKAGAAEVTER